jgi:pyrroloquinoline quinone (PQQ) biosynthesis protein C
MTREEFQEALLGVMEGKVHWAWPLFQQGKVAKEKMHVHLENEYGTYVRDFPVLVARAYVQCPIAAVRRDLIENVYEEETGGIAAGRPHPELFLLYPQGLGMDLERFESVELLPEAKLYRATLDEYTERRGWEVAAAVTTLFLEGTPYDRAELEPQAEKRPTPPLSEHPLVKHYGLPTESLALTRAHRNVEGQHRAAAWRSILDHVAEEARPLVVEAMDATRLSWLRYRDAVAEACGLNRGMLKD